MESPYNQLVPQLSMVSAGQERQVEEEPKEVNGEIATPSARNDRQKRSASDKIAYMENGESR